MSSSSPIAPEPPPCLLLVARRCRGKTPVSSSAASRARRLASKTNPQCMSLVGRRQNDAIVSQTDHTQVEVGFEGGQHRLGLTDREPAAHAHAANRLIGDLDRYSRISTELFDDVFQGLAGKHQNAIAPRQALRELLWRNQLHLIEHDRAPRIWIVGSRAEGGNLAGA